MPSRQLKAKLLWDFDGPKAFATHKLSGRPRHSHAIQDHLLRHRRQGNAGARGGRTEKGDAEPERDGNNDWEQVRFSI